MKKFIAVWGDAYAPEGESIVKTVDIPHYVTTNGYESDDITAVHHLEIGESMNVNDPNGHQSVVRIK